MDGSPSQPLRFAVVLALLDNTVRAAAVRMRVPRARVTAAPDGRAGPRQCPRRSSTRAVGHAIAPTDRAAVQRGALL